MKYHFRNSWQFGLLYGTCLQILRENVNMHQISVKFMPWLLIDKQQQHVFLWQELLVR